MAASVHEFTVKDIDGQDVSLDKYKGKPALIVNVASNCGLTGNNYKQLQEIYSKYGGKLAILGFPCNQFGAQEPGCSTDIKEFIKKKGITFDMFDKLDVNGDTAAPLYKYLKAEKGGTEIKWNFAKFLVDQNGKPVNRYEPTVEPKDITKDIDALVA